MTGEGMDELRQYFAIGKTIAFLGSSGVGKSTLVNVLAGAEILKTQEVLRDDDRGRHTTSHRQLVLLPGGGVVMDTPGMRTMGIWEADTGLDNLFGDIEQLAQMCRFSDCRHDSEPGCAVKQSLEDGTLDEARWKNYKKLLKELAHVERKRSQNPNFAVRQQGRQFAKKIRNNKKEVW
jgi:ribosome biogenesis GTPase